jgi:hypothetical protein
MCAYLDTKEQQPYKYEVDKGLWTSISKVVYADDSTIFQENAQGAQEMADGVSEFAAASGTIVKPEKSHSCQNKCEDDVYVTTWSFHTAEKKYSRVMAY